MVHYYEIDRERRLTLPALMHYLEDVATLDSESRGITLDRYFRTGRLFLLLKWDIVVRSLPFFNETVRITTRPTTFKRFLANREYAVFGRDGAPLAEARSVWAFTDIRRKKPVRVPEEIFTAFGVPPESAESFDPLEDLPGIAAGSAPHPIRVGPADLDNNGHVNNVRYVEWALWSLPADFLRGRGPSRVRVHYKKELTPGGEAELFSEIAGGDGKPVSAHSFRGGGREICDVRIDWAARDAGRG